MNTEKLRPLIEQFREAKEKFDNYDFNYSNDPEIDEEFYHFLSGDLAHKAQLARHAIAKEFNEIFGDEIFDDIIAAILVEWGLA